MIYTDTETCGLHGPIVLIQHAVGDGPIHLHEVWKEPAYFTLKLIEKIVDSHVVGFNLAFDWFHFCQTYTTLSLLEPDDIPDECIGKYIEAEAAGRDGLCLKPKGALDLMLHARKGPYQSTLPRKDIYIRKVPAVLGPLLLAELEKRITLDSIYFANRKVKSDTQWVLAESPWGPEWVDVVMRFNPSGALKTLAAHALGVDVTLHDEIALPKRMYPEEHSGIPFAKGLVGKKAWPLYIKHHIDHWSYNLKARKYAEDDVHFTRELHHHFGDPSTDDRDSMLACMLAAVRWHGYTVDIEGLKELHAEAAITSESFPRHQAGVMRMLGPLLSDLETIVLKDDTGKISTEKIRLESISKWDDHPAAKIAEGVLNARKAKQSQGVFETLLNAGRFHSGGDVGATLSGRSGGGSNFKGVESGGRGGGGLNAQGINSTEAIRSKFPLAPPGFRLDGGDFDAFEPGIAATVYGDEKLTAMLLGGQKMYPILGKFFFEGETYDSITASKGEDNDLYKKSKTGVLGMLYGGDAGTLVRRIGIDEEAAEDGFKEMFREFPGIKKAQERIYNMFCSMRQPKGIGTQVEWHEPSDYIETILGYRRYFTLENKICKTLFELANDPPEAWKALRVKVVRRDRTQTAAGATMSALFGSAFQIQAQNMRAAANHEIQSVGAEVTKELQYVLWELQPSGITPWRILPMNVHDEVNAPNNFEEGVVLKVVNDFIEEWQGTIPLLKMDWQVGMDTWAGKV